MKTQPGSIYLYLIAVMYSGKGKQKTQKGGTDTGPEISREADEMRIWAKITS